MLINKHAERIGHGRYIIQHVLLLAICLVCSSCAKSDIRDNYKIGMYTQERQLRGGGGSSSYYGKSMAVDPNRAAGETTY